MLCLQGQDGLHSLNGQPLQSQHLLSANSRVGGYGGR
jgi:hypothetical protein